MAHSRPTRCCHRPVIRAARVGVHTGPFGVEVRQARSFLRQPIEMGRANVLAAVTAQVGIAHVVGQDQDDVRPLRTGRPLGTSGRDDKQRKQAGRDDAHRGDPPGLRCRTRREGGVNENQPRYGGSSRRPTCPGSPRPARRCDRACSVLDPEQVQHPAAAHMVFREPGIERGGQRRCSRPLPGRPPARAGPASAVRHRSAAPAWTMRPPLHRRQPSGRTGGRNGLPKSSRSSSHRGRLSANSLEDCIA